MRKFLVAFLVLASAPAMAQQSVPEIPFDSVPNFLKLPPDLYIGEPTGVAVNSKGHVFVFSRGGSSTGPAYAETAAQLLEFAPDGKYIREIGKNLYAWSFAHAVRVDKQDNIWAVDKGSDMIVKFDPRGPRRDGVRPQAGSVRRRHRPLEASEPAAARRRRPLPPADRRDMGQCRQHLYQRRLHQFAHRQARQGRQLDRSRGARAAAGRANSTRRTTSRADAKDNIYVADRGNRRIQVFDTSGNFLRQFTIDVPAPPDARMVIGNKYPDPMGADVPSLLKPGAPWVICITPPPHQFLYTADAFPGRIYKLTLDGKLARHAGPARARS